MRTEKPWVYLYGNLAGSYFEPYYGSMDIVSPKNTTLVEIPNELIQGPFKILTYGQGRSSAWVDVVNEFNHNGITIELQVRLRDFVEYVKQGKVREGKLFTDLIGKRSAGGTLWFSEAD